MDTVLPDFTRLYCSFARKLSTDVQYWSLLQPVFRIWILLISLLTFRMPTKKFCCLNFFFFFNFWRYIYIIFKDKKSKKKSQSRRNQGFSSYFCLVTEGSGSKPLTNGSGSGSRRPKNMWIRNTGRKNAEYAERNFHVQQCLMKLKGQYFKKIKWGIINCPNKNKNFIFLLLLT